MVLMRDGKDYFLINSAALDMPLLARDFNGIEWINL